MKQWIVLAVAVLALRGTAWGQTREIDSLMVELQAHPRADEARVNMLVVLAAKLNSARPQAAILLAREGLRTAQSLNYPMGQARALTQLATCTYERGDLDSAKFFYEGALRLYKVQTGEKPKELQLRIIRAQNGLASVYAIKGKFDPALKLFIENLAIAEQIQDKRMQLQSLGNMGSLAEQMADHERALRYYNQTLLLADSVVNIHEYETCLANIAGLYSNEKKHDLAASYANRALRLTEISGDIQNRGTMQNVLGQAALAANRVAEARQRFGSALKLGQQAGDNYLVSRSLLLLGQTALQQKQYLAARQYYQQALPVLLEIGVFDDIRDAYQGLGVVSLALGDYKTAALNQQQQIAFGDSAMNEQRLSETRLLQTKYETEKKESQNRLQAAQLRTQQQVIRRRNVQLWGGLAMAGLLAGLAYLLYNRRRLRREVEFGQERQQLQRLRSQAVLEAEETERRRIGSDLHDGVGQLLTAAKLNLHALGEQLGEQTPGQQALMQNALTLVDESFVEVRSISHNLMPNALIKRGLAQAVREFIDKLPPDGRVKITLEVVGLDRGGRLDTMLENVLFRVIQELVQNILKHAQATEVTLQIIRHANELTVQVEDNGVGFDPAALAPEAGIGLKNIESRMAFLGGRADFDAAPGRGTTVTLEVPLAAA